MRQQLARCRVTALACLAQNGSRQTHRIRCHSLPVEMVFLCMRLQGMPLASSMGNARAAANLYGTYVWSSSMCTAEHRARVACL